MEYQISNLELFVLSGLQIPQSISSEGIFLLLTVFSNIFPF